MRYFFLLLVVISIVYLVRTDSLGFFENFALQAKVFFKRCPEGMSPVEGVQDFCVSDTTGEYCSTDREIDNGDDIPICPEPTQGTILSYFDTEQEHFTQDERLAHEDLNPAYLSGIGLPLTKRSPRQTRLSDYEGKLVVARNEMTGGEERNGGEGIYVKDGVPYRVSPLGIFNDSDHVVVRVDRNVFDSLERPKMPALQEAPWFSKSSENTFNRFSGKLLKRDDSRNAGGYIYEGKIYAIHLEDCDGDVPVMEVSKTSPIYDLLPTAGNFYDFELGYKQPWFKEVCKVEPKYHKFYY